MTQARTLYEKIWDAHLVTRLADGSSLIYVDLHLVNEVTSPQAFDGLRQAERSVLRPECTLAVADHNVPTNKRVDGKRPIEDEASRAQVEALENNVYEFGIPYVPLDSTEQGIVHVIGPELGLTLPGSIIVCGDSHTSTHGAFGALAFGIGTSQAEHVLATQMLVQSRAKTMLIKVEGSLGPRITAKDLALHIIATIGTNGATGHVIEYAGPAITDLDMAGRMTLCNLSIEAGARAGMIAPDEKTFRYISGRRFAPRESGFRSAVSDWMALRSDEDADYDRVVTIDAQSIEPMVTWGTSPEAGIAVDGLVPLAEDCENVRQRQQAEKMMRYMDVAPGSAIAGTPIDVVFIGSCTNGRIEDLRAAASIVKDRKVAPTVRALVVPGSGNVKLQAEAEGLDAVFVSAGFEWREPGCSMCLGMNPDQLSPGQRCASTSNRNFEGRQGRSGRTHLMSPEMAAAAAIAGRIIDVRELTA